MQRRSILLGCALLALGGAMIAEPTQAAPDSFMKRLVKSRMNDGAWSKGVSEVHEYQTRTIVEKRPRQSRSYFVIERHSSDQSTKSKLEYFFFQNIHEVNLGATDLDQHVAITFGVSPRRILRFDYSFQEWGELAARSLDYMRKPPRASWTTIRRDLSRRQNARFDPSYLAGAVHYEAIPFLLRFVNPDAGAMRFVMVEPFANPEIGRPRKGSAKVLFAPVTELRLVGVDYKVRPVILSHFLGEDRLWLNLKAPHQILQWETFNGGKYEWRRSYETDYWNRRKPGDTLQGSSAAKAN